MCCLVMSTEQTFPPFHSALCVENSKIKPLQSQIEHLGKADSKKSRGWGQTPLKQWEKQSYAYPADLVD